jgi:hypothetical protein
LCECQLCLSHNATQKVIKIMGDPTGKHSQALQLLFGEGLGLRAPYVGNVRNHCDPSINVLVLVSSWHVQLVNESVFSAIIDFGFEFFWLTGEDLLYVGMDLVIALLADHVENRAARDFLWRQLQPSRVAAVYPQISVSSIVEWLKGTALRPFFDALPDDTSRNRFVGDYAGALRLEYRPRADGNVLFPFRRLFLVASR